MQDVQRRIVCRQGEARKNSLLSAQFIYQCNIALKKKKYQKVAQIQNRNNYINTVETKKVVHGTISARATLGVNEI